MHAPLERTWVKLFLLLGAVAIVYANSLHGPFVFDDWHVIPQNPAVHDLDNVPRFFTDPSAFSLLEGNRDYRPVFLTAAALAWSLGDGSTVPFHVLSVAVHAGSALLVFLILRLLLGWSAETRKIPEEQREWTALVGAGIFGLHPLATESVSYVVQQAEVWAVFFYLLAFLLFLRAFAKRGAIPSVGRGGLIAASCAAYFLALLSKPNAITLVLILALWEVLLGDPDRRRHVFDPGRWVKLVPYAAVAGSYLIIRSMVFVQPFGPGEPPRSAWVHYLTQTKALVFYYAGHAFFPVGLNVDPRYPTVQSVLDPWFLGSVAVLGVVGWLLYRFRHRRLILFFALWFPVSMLVTSYGVVLGQIVNEHRAYIALVGFAAVVAMALLMAWR